MDTDTQAARGDIPPGTRFGRYEVIAEIASGGMATVFLGRALGAAGFQRLVAIKCLHPHMARDEEFVGMFMDEARLAARIHHPNVVPTLDLENGSDGLFLVMEWVEGDGLLGLLRALLTAGERMPPPVALRIVLDVLQGLHAAHELTGDRGEPLRLVHRDVSPHNILVGTDGVARITDFGIAHAEERLSVTRDGQVKGKLAYMAPEQTAGVPVDRRVDLFSVGVVLWEALAGKRLFYGLTDAEVLRNLLTNPLPKLRDTAPEVPAALEAVCERALERDPDERFQTAAQFAEALEEAGGALGIASARAVAKFVRATSGARIDALSAQARGGAGDGRNTSAVRPVPRARLVTADPERTTERADTAPTSPTGARIPTGTRIAATALDGPAIGPPPVRPTSLTPRGLASRSTEASAPFATGAAGPSRARRSALVASFVACGILALGASAALLIARRPSPVERVAPPVLVGAPARSRPAALAPALAPSLPPAVAPAVSPLAPPVAPLPDPALMRRAAHRGARGRSGSAPAVAPDAPSEPAPIVAPPEPAPSSHEPFNPEAM